MLVLTPDEGSMIELLGEANSLLRDIAGLDTERFRAQLLNLQDQVFALATRRLLITPQPND